MEDCEGEDMGMRVEKQRREEREKARKAPSRQVRPQPEDEGGMETFKFCLFVTRTIDRPPAHTPPFIIP